MPDAEKCEICGNASSNVQISDAVLDKDIIKICHACARIEGAVIMPQPSKQQLVEADRPYTVYERLVRASGVDSKQANIAKKTTEASLSSLQEEWFKRKQDAGKESRTEAQGRKEIQESGSQSAINFKSRRMRIADLRNMRDKFFVRLKQENQHPEEQEKETEVNIDVDKLIS